MATREFPPENVCLINLLRTLGCLALHLGLLALYCRPFGPRVKNRRHAEVKWKWGIQSLKGLRLFFCIA